MTCPVCKSDVTETRIGPLTACASCHRTLVEDGDVLIVATAADTAGLSAEERAALLALRARPRLERRFR